MLHGFTDALEWDGHGRYCKSCGWKNINVDIVIKIYNFSFMSELTILTLKVGSNYVFFTLYKY